MTNEELAAALRAKDMTEEEEDAIRDAMTPEERTEWDRQQFEWAKQVLESLPEEERRALRGEIIKDCGGAKKMFLDLYGHFKASDNTVQMAEWFAYVEEMRHTDNPERRELAEQILTALRNDS